MPYRLAIFETHPIQYKVPWFRGLAQHPEIDLTVFYCLIPDARQQGVGFGVEFQWDIPLLEGYPHVTLKNVAANPGVTHFGGCDTPEIGQFIRPGAFDAVIINGWVVKSCVQALWACRRAGVPAILRCEANGLRPRAWWKTMIHRLLLRQFSAFIAIGTANRNFYLERGVRAARIVDGFYCVENDRFAVRSAELRAARHRAAAKQSVSAEPGPRELWGIRDDAAVFLFCGKFEPKKRPMDVLRALERLAAADRGFAHGCNASGALETRPAASTPSASGLRVPGSSHPPSVHLLMVGAGPLQAECEAFALEQHLPVTFTGFLNQSDMPSAYAAADCLVLPSDYGETWGLVVNEAMACGLPAITSDRVGCHLDLIVAGKTGAVFRYGDVEALAASMRQFAADPGALQQMGENARLHVQAYSIDALVRGTLAALRLGCVART